MNKKTKVLSITLPVTLTTATLASTAGILVSCSKNTTSDNSNVNQNPNIDISLNSSNIQNFETNLNSRVADITIEQFNNYFVGDQATTNINIFAEKLGISKYTSNIESIVASGEYNNATITISISDGYNFVLNDDQSSIQSGVTSAISEDKKSLVFSGVVFANDKITNVLIKQSDINSFASSLDSEVSVLSVDEFNSFFINSQGIENIKKVEKSLGINLNDNVISSIVAEGQYNDATITILANDNYKFVEETETLSIGKISIDGNSIVFSNVIFLNSNLPEISQISRDATLQNRLFPILTSSEATFSTNSNNNSRNYIDGTAFNVFVSTITEEEPFIKVPLPNYGSFFTSSNVSNLNSANVKWSIKNQTNFFKIVEDSNYQFIYNTQALTPKEVETIILTAYVFDSSTNKLIAKPVDVTFYFGIATNVNNINLDNTSDFDKTIYLDVDGSLIDDSNHIYPNITVHNNTINAQFDINSIIPFQNERAPFFCVNLNLLDEAIIKNIFNCNVPINGIQRTLYVDDSIKGNLPTFRQNYYQQYNDIISDSIQNFDVRNLNGSFEINIEFNSFNPFFYSSNGNYSWTITINMVSV